MVAEKSREPAKSGAMPLFIDIHHVPGITSQEAAAGHILDIDVQGPFNVNYMKYWFNEDTGKIFCLCDAPNMEAAIAVHHEAHGAGAERIIEVTPELAEMFLGPAPTDTTGAVVLPARYGRVQDGGSRVVLFTDIVDSTTLTQRLGDEGAMELIQRHDEIVGDAIRGVGGRIIKHTGDGMMAVFLSSVVAMRCAADIQSGMHERGEVAGETLRVRIGAAVGEPVEHHDDIFGATVQLASRLCGEAGAGEVLVSNVLAELCRGKGLTFGEPREVALKGFQEPVAVRQLLGVAAVRERA